MIIGSGFGGLFAAKALKKAPVQVTIIDKTVQHLFQPLLYQVATGILSQGVIAPPTREILNRQRNAEVLLGEVTDVDVEARTVTHRVGEYVTTTPYDSLIVSLLVQVSPTLGMTNSRSSRQGSRASTMPWNCVAGSTVPSK